LGDYLSDVVGNYNPQYVGADMKFCSGCGRAVHKTANACPNCGAKQAGFSSKSKIAAALFAFFLGGFGAHKFYLGRPGWGLLYLVFFWTFVPAIVAFFEFIFLLAMSDERFAEKYK
jgi:TM2 domain-containing membrane protein YozV